MSLSPHRQCVQVSLGDLLITTNQVLTTEASIGQHAYPGLLQHTDHCLGKFVDIWLHYAPRLRQVPSDLPLARILNLSIAERGRQQLFVSKVLAPSFEVFGGPTEV